MKKLISFIVAVFTALLCGFSVFAAELPERYFIALPEDIPAEEAAVFAFENNFTGIVADLRKSDSVKYYKELVSAGNGLSVFAFADESLFSELPAEAAVIAESGVSEEALASLSERNGSGKISLYIPFGDGNARSAAKNYYEKGYFESIFAENLLSCYSDMGYEEYLIELAAEFSDADIITLNDLGRVLSPVAKGDFYGEEFELNNQYLVNKINGFDFCVSDINDLLSDKFGRAGFLMDYFTSTVLDEYADFDISQKLEITRPTGNSLYVETYSYTIFGTSNPEKPLFMNGAEIERTSESGLFAVTVDVPKKGRTFTFTNGGTTDSVKLIRGSGSGSGSGKTNKLTSVAPSSAALVKEGEETVTLSCVGPSGGKVSANFNGKTFSLEQVAYADPGVPARFTAKVPVSGEFPSGEVTSLGKVKYTLRYNGNTKNYESEGEIYYIGEGASFAVRANVNLAGVDIEPQQTGFYITTLRTGCADYVSEIAESGWYKLSMGGYINPAHCDIITGKSDITCTITGSSKTRGGNYEKLVLNCTEMPAFVGKIHEKSLSLTLYNTDYAELSGIDLSSELIRRTVAVDNGDGSITLNLYSTEKLWGWDVFPDPENGTFTIMLKPVPQFSDDPAKPLSGINITVCPGHGGIDPGALSVAGEKGVNEAQINLANIMAIAEALENLGANVQRLYTTDEKYDTYERTDPAREFGCDIYINCHANSVAENAKANLWCGTYIYYHFDHSAEFSQKLCDYISSATKRDNEGAVQDYYSVTRLTMCPAVMMEVGFVSNPSELESLIDQRNIQKTAYATVKAVMEIIGE